MNLRQKMRIRFITIIVLAVIAGLISYPQIIQKFPPAYDFLNTLKINLGLDLQGGIHLEYKADVSGLESNQVGDALQAVQDVIERRINAFGVGEPLVQTSQSRGEHRIIVELPGIKDIEGAKKQIKETPLLEFKEEASEEDMKQYEGLFESSNNESKNKAEEVLEKVLAGEDFSALAKEFSQDPGSQKEGGDLGFAKKGTFVPEFDEVLFENNLQDGEVYPELVETQFGWHVVKKIEERPARDASQSEAGGAENGEKEVHTQHILLRKQNPEMFPDLKYKSTGLSGKNLESATVVFQTQGLGEPQVSLKFDGEGTKLFADITKKNLNKPVAIYLDGQIISAPTVQTEITNGEAVITGSFSVDEAKQLARRLNEGALPVPLTLISQQSVEASLGKISLEKSLFAGLIGIIAVIIYMIIYYRFLGVIASVTLLVYAALMVSVIKLSGLSPFAITLTLSGIAGFILSLGMAVDANILIFERTREELKNGRSLQGAIEEGFKRAWTSIRDGNLSTVITTIILIWLGTGFVKGFAIVLLIGVLLSMFTAIILTRNILRFVLGIWAENKLWMIANISKKEN